MRKLILLAVPFAFFLGGCGGDHYYSYQDSPPGYSEVRTEYSDGSARSFDTSRASPPFGNYPVNDRVTVRSG